MPPKKEANKTPRIPAKFSYKTNLVDLQLRFATEVIDDPDGVKWLAIESLIKQVIELNLLLKPGQSAFYTEE